MAYQGEALQLCVRSTSVSSLNPTELMIANKRSSEGSHQAERFQKHALSDTQLQAH